MALVLKVDVSPNAMLTLNDPWLTSTTADSTYLRLDCANDPLTATLEARSINPDVTNSRTLGSNNTTNQWSHVRSRNIVGFTKPSYYYGYSYIYRPLAGTVSIPSGGVNGGAPGLTLACAGKVSSGATSTVVNSSNPGIVVGFADATASSGTATVTGTGNSVLVVGTSTSTATTSVAKVEAQAAGLVFGEAQALASGAKAYVGNTGSGNLTIGSVLAAGANATSKVTCVAPGSMALGFVTTNVAAAQVGLVQTSGAALGGVAIGYVKDFGTIEAKNAGSIAIGAVYGNGTGSSGTILSGSGSGFGGNFAFGTIDGTGDIFANTSPGAGLQGAFSGGATLTNNIAAQGPGCFAFGYADSATIQASNTTSGNVAQFFPGSNTMANSMQIGSAGLRFKGTTGAPGTLQNGDMWLNNNYVYIRSNGVTCKVTNAVL